MRLNSIDPMLTQKDTTAWLFQVYAAFIISTGSFAASLYLLPMDNVVRSQLGISYVFSISASVSLTKTIRDNHEARKRHALIDAIITDKAITENHPLIELLENSKISK
ncbi:MAG: hypothetical protein DCF19_17525 [Pseudanabaena frigida]|uniref:YiaAB two helix domain-containing protein n=1 Tax=Pseudanabaena frigida TaxID=945775 RepID=A0A2W4VYU4_9CYAN|nr:MAG: hypothetical protein DCF19_17525 [Pseudanabaena frigida]